MARHKEFDRQLVLEKAMETFWQYGYEGTSVQTLLGVMGLNRGSLYDTFGDKRSLFLEAIAHYEKKVMQDAIAKLEAPDAGKTDILNHFQSLLNQVEVERSKWGCFVTNVAVELCSHDEEASDCIKKSLTRVEKAFHHALTNAQRQGEIPPDADVSALATFLTCTMQGLRVMAKVDPCPQRLNSMITSALSVLA